MFKAIILAAMTAFAANAAILDDFSGNSLGGELNSELVTLSDQFSLGSDYYIGNGNLLLSNGFGSVSELTLQWDGLDNSMDLNPYGLGGVYLDSTQFTIDSDLSAWFTMTVWSNGNTWSDTKYLEKAGILDFGQHSNVGAVEFSIKGIESYDMRMQPVVQATAPQKVGSYILLAAVALVSISIGRFLARKPD